MAGQSNCSISEIYCLDNCFFPGVNYDDDDWNDDGGDYDLKFHCRLLATNLCVMKPRLLPHTSNLFRTKRKVKKELKKK